jgi:hypothetical protein
MVASDAGDGSGVAGFLPDRAQSLGVLLMVSAPVVPVISNAAT